MELETLPYLLVLLVCFILHSVVESLTASSFPQPEALWQSINRVYSPDVQAP